MMAMKIKKPNTKRNIPRTNQPTQSGELLLLPPLLLLLDPELERLELERLDPPPPLL
jgi:hypothetical protein